MFVKLKMPVRIHHDYNTEITIKENALCEVVNYDLESRYICLKTITDKTSFYLPLDAFKTITTELEGGI